MMNEDGRTFTGNGAGPVPVGDEDQVVERVGPPQALVAPAMGGPHHEVVVRIARIVGPEVEADA